eukprot:COSAG01_NODE_50037_length_367_cov_0.518657_1_plen_56_part_10
MTKETAAFGTIPAIECPSAKCFAVRGFRRDKALIAMLRLHRCRTACHDGCPGGDSL